MRIRGVAGTDLHDAWAEGARAYLGISVPGFPNLFLVYGPNTNLGGSSIIGMLEAQARHIAQAVRAASAHEARRIEVRREVADRFDAEIQERLGHSAWAGCVSWYRETGGRISTNWPGLVAEYVDRTAALDLDDYAVGVDVPGEVPA
jgi:hypothetical protein